MRRRWKGKRAQGTGFPVVVSSVQEYLTSVLIWNRATSDFGAAPVRLGLQRDESSRTGDAGNDPALVGIQWRASVENDEPSGMIGPRPLGADGGTLEPHDLAVGDFKSPASAISPHRLPGQSPQLTWVAQCGTRTFVCVSVHSPRPLISLAPLENWVSLDRMEASERVECPYRGGNGPRFGHVCARAALYHGLRGVLPPFRGPRRVRTGRDSQPVGAGCKHPPRVNAFEEGRDIRQILRGDSKLISTHHQGNDPDPSGWRPADAGSSASAAGGLHDERIALGQQQALDHQSVFGFHLGPVESAGDFRAGVDDGIQEYFSGLSSRPSGQVGAYSVPTSPAR